MVREIISNYAMITDLFKRSDFLHSHIVMIRSPAYVQRRQADKPFGLPHGSKK